MKGVKSALRRTETAWKNKIKGQEDCELPLRGGSRSFFVPKNERSKNHE